MTGTPAILRVLFHPLAVLVTLVAAESIGMLAVSPFIGRDKGYIVFAGLAILPFWAVLLTLVYTADRSYRALAVLASAAAVSTFILLQ